MSHEENDRRAQDVRRVHCPASRPSSHRLKERNEMLDARKVSIEAIFDLGLHVRILVGYKCFRNSLRLYSASVTLEWLLTLLLALYHERTMSLTHKHFLCLAFESGNYAI